MGRGVSCGGAQSSLDYLFGSPEPQKPGPNKQVEKAIPTSTEKLKEIPTGIHGNTGNNYFSAEGQNTGNFITVQLQPNTSAPYCKNSRIASRNLQQGSSGFFLGITMPTLIKWDDSNVIQADMSLEVSELFTWELTRYIDETEEIAMNGLMQNKDMLDMIARELLSNSRITGLEVQDRMKQMTTVMFDDFVQPFQINADEDGPLPRNDRLSYQPLDVYAAPLHWC